MKEPRITRTLVRLLSVFHNNPDTDFYGLDLAERIGSSYGSLLLLLSKLEDIGWLASDWENIDPVEKGRPKRKYYRLTNKGRAIAKQHVTDEIEFLTRKARLA